jgi:Uma2 family endonuclease
MSSRVAVTYQHYAALPDDGKRYEVHDGELWQMPAPTLHHQIVLANLADALRAHVKQRALGVVLFAPLDVILSDRPDETTILQPDLVYVAHARREALQTRGIEGPPTLAVEILSTSTATIDRTRKRALYARYGVPYLWLVDPEARLIEAHVLRDAQYALAACVSGTEPCDLPPFVSLGLVPASLWP